MVCIISKNENAYTFKMVWLETLSQPIRSEEFLDKIRIKTFSQALWMHWIVHVNSLLWFWIWVCYEFNGKAPKKMAENEKKMCNISQLIYHLVLFAFWYWPWFVAWHCLRRARCGNAEKEKLKETIEQQKAEMDLTWDKKKWQ